jgi:hypothetical protein
MQSASQAAAFYREVARHRLVWTIRDENGFPAPLNPDGGRAQPFWSSRGRAERIIATVAAYRGFTPVEIALDVFLERWVPGLARDGILVGVNWTGDRATGYDIAPGRVAECIASVGRDGQ